MNILKKKSILLFLPLIALAVFLYPHPTHAAWSLVGFAYDSIKQGIAGLLYNIVLMPLVWFLSLAGTLVNYALQPDNLPITTSAFVLKGWEIMRDLTNMLFILVMLAIALDYILFNSVGVKRALPRLLLVALLINFSLPIAGVVIDFANVFTDFFMSRAGGANFTETMATKFGLASIFNMKEDFTLATGAQAIDGAITTTIFSIFYVSGTLFVFVALAIMFFIRYFYLSVLLIVLPLVLVTSILPQMGSHYRKWMDKFISWTMFAPAASFFLYLSMVFLDTQINDINTVLTEKGWASGIATQATTFIFAWMLIFMSLTTANKMGIAGASVAINTYNRGSRWAKGKASAGGGAAARWAGREASTRAGQIIQPEKLGGRAADIVAGIPLVGGMASRGVRGLGMKAEGAMIKKPAQLTNEEKTKYATYTGTDLLREAESFMNDKSAASKAKSAALYEMAANKGKLKILKEDGTLDEAKTNELVKRAYSISKKHGNKPAMEAIMKANPVVYQEIAQEEWEGMAREGKLAGDAYDIKTRQLIQGRRRDSGETFEDARNKAFEKMSGTDFENLKGMWDKKTTKVFLMSGVMGTNHIKMAAGANDNSFLNNLSSNLNDLTDNEIEFLINKNPSLINSLEKTGNITDIVATQTLREKIDAIRNKKTAGGAGGAKSGNTSNTPPKPPIGFRV